MAKPVMLWFDCTSRAERPELRRLAMAHFEVTTRLRLDQAAGEVARTRARLLCFDFDYPDRDRLRTLQAIKRAHVSLPVLMLTIEHSEALAVWAFRVPVWNYLVKPVATAEWQDNLQALAQILPAERRSGRSIYLNEPSVPRAVPAGRPDDPQHALLPALSFVEQHFSTCVSASDVAKICGMTRFQFSRMFHAAFGLTFREYLLRFRISEACRLLEQQSASVTEVGCAAGFNDSSYFARMFRRYTGMLPSVYVKSHVRPSPASLHPSFVLTRATRQLPVERVGTGAPSLPNEVPEEFEVAQPA
jgi:AraC-like DNA-binding protein